MWRGSRSANVLASVGEHRHAVIIGGQRCGSTLLAHLLADHPDIRLAQPERPEPKFFLRSGDHDEYHRLHFPIEAPLLLEKSTTYLERPDSALRMREFREGVRPIVILRDPVERAISNWMFSRQNGLEDLPAPIAFSKESEMRPYPDSMSTSPFHYLRRSNYSTLLRPWIESMSIEGISLLLFESLIADPEKVVMALQAEFGLKAHKPASIGRVNPSDPTEAVGQDLIARLRGMVRPEAEAIARFLPEAALLWPTLA